MPIYRWDKEIGKSWRLRLLKSVAMAQNIRVLTKNYPSSSKDCSCLWTSYCFALAIDQRIQVETIFHIAEIDNKAFIKKNALATKIKIKNSTKVNLHTDVV